MFKKYLLVALITTFAMTVSAVNRKPEATVNYQGKPDPAGKTIAQWLYFARHYDISHNYPVRNRQHKIIRFKQWQNILFYEHNQELVRWEITKALKKNMFRLAFFRQRQYNVPGTDGYVAFWADFPPVKNSDSAALIFYNAELTLLGSSSNLSYSLAILKKLGKVGQKQYRLLIQDAKRIGRSVSIYKPPAFTISGEVERKKAFAAYLQDFTNGRIGNRINTRRWQQFIHNWDVNMIIRTCLQKKLVNKKNSYNFYHLLLTEDNLPEDIIAEIIKYWGLDGNKGELVLDEYLACLPIYNAKLRKAILNNLKSIKYREDSSGYKDAITVYQHGLTPAIQLNRLGAHLPITYARLTGDSNKAFELAGKIAAKEYKKEQIALQNLHSYNPKLAAEIIANAKEKGLTAQSRTRHKQSAWAYLLLFENSDLKLKTARQLLNYILAKPNLIIRTRQRSDQAFMHPKRLQPAYAALLSIADYQRHPKNTLQLLYYTDPQAIKPKLRQLVLKNKTYQTWCNKQGKKNYFAHNSYNYLAALQRIIKKLKHRPNESELIDICKRLAPLSLYALPAAPVLRPFITAKNIDFDARIKIIITLAEIGDKQSLPLIKKYTHDPNQLLAKAARQAMFLLQPMQLSLDSEFIHSMANFRQKY